MKSVGNYSSRISIRRLNSLQEWLDLRELWNQLNRSSDQPSVFRSFEWTYHWCRTFLGADTRSTRVLVAEDSVGALLAVFPLHCTESRRGREWRMIGEMHGHHSIAEEPTLLLGSEACSPCLPELFRYLHDTARFDWDSYRFDIQSPLTTPLVEEISTLCRLNQFIYRKSHGMGGSVFVELPETWDIFRRSLSRSMRDNLSYYRRRLQKEGYSWAVRFLKTPEAVREAVPLLVDLHHTRCSGDNGTIQHENHLPTQNHIRFLTELLPDLAWQGEAFIGVVDVDGIPVAAQSFFVVENVLTFYYSGFRTLWNPYSPLFILAEEVIRDAIAGGGTLPGAGHTSFTNVAVAPCRFHSAP